jgi:hypothetical protein
MITRCGLFGGKFLSSLNRIPKRLAHVLLTSMFFCLPFLAGCEKSGNESTAQTSPSSTESASQPTAKSSPVTTDNKYELGTVIHFGTGGGSERFKQSGWSVTEKDATWTTGNAAKLTFSLDSSDQALSLRMRLAGLAGVTKAPNTLAAQSVEVFANGEKIADWDVSSVTNFTAVIPATTVQGGGALTIELKMPKAVSPKSLGVSTDARVLGVYCFELAITKGS